MSAKHRRPFAVFAAVAVICGMVLITGVRSKAEDARAPEHDMAVAPGTTVSPTQATQGSDTIEASPPSVPEAQGDLTENPDTSAFSELDEPPAGDSGNEEGNAPTDLPDGVIPLEIPDPTDVDLGDEESGNPGDSGDGKDGKGRGGRGKDGKNDKDEDKDGDKGGDGQPDDEEPVDADELTDQPVDEGLPETDLPTDAP